MFGSEATVILFFFFHLLPISHLASISRRKTQDKEARLYELKDNELSIRSINKNDGFDLEGAGKEGNLFELSTSPNFLNKIKPKRLQRKHFDQIENSSSSFQMNTNITQNRTIKEKLCRDLLKTVYNTRTLDHISSLLIYRSKFHFLSFFTKFCSDLKSNNNKTNFLLHFNNSVINTSVAAIRRRLEKRQRLVQTRSRTRKILPKSFNDYAPSSRPANFYSMLKKPSFNLSSSKLRQTTRNFLSRTQRNKRSLFKNSLEHGVSNGRIPALFLEKSGKIVCIFKNGKVRGIDRKTVDKYCAIKVVIDLNRRRNGVMVAKLYGMMTRLYIAMASDFTIYTTCDSNDPNTDFEYHFKDHLGDWFMSVLHQSFLSFTQRGKPLKKRVSEKFDQRAQFLSSLDLRKYNDSVEEIFRSTPPLDPRPKKFYGRNCDLSQKASTVSSAASQKVSTNSSTAKRRKCKKGKSKRRRKCKKKSRKRKKCKRKGKRRKCRKKKKKHRRRNKKHRQTKKNTKRSRHKASSEPNSNS